VTHEFSSVVGVCIFYVKSKKPTEPHQFGQFSSVFYTLLCGCGFTFDVAPFTQIGVV